MWSPMKSADYARDVIATMERETKSKAARKRMAELVLSHGNYDQEAMQIWRDYLESFR